MTNRLLPATSLVVAALFFSACASNDDMASTAANADGTANPMIADNAVDPDAMRCRNEIKTGTRISNKICKTNRQWNQEAIDSRTAAENIQRGALSGSSPSGG